jgi:hypothetical protein
MAKNTPIKKVAVKGNDHKTGNECLREMNVSVGNLNAGNYPPVNPYGTGTMRGYGAATKGHKISGKMG